MIRNSAKFTALAVATLLGSVATVNCSKSGGSDDKPVGHVNLALQLASGAKVNTVHYKIHASTPTGISDVEGDINTSDPNATASAYHSFPASMGDVVTLSATTTAGIACSGNSMPFTVTANNVAAVDVTLVCGGSVPTQNGGSVAIMGTVVEGDNCPLLTSWAASPLQTSLDGTIDVSGAASDADVGVIPGETLTYAWSSTGGTFADATAQSTKFTCKVSGAQTITLSVTDNHVPMSCPTSVQIPVNCVGGIVCGNGVVEAGEACEGVGSYTPNVGICGANCQYQAPVCGNAKVELGEGCDDGNTVDGDGCSSACQKQSVCGNGIVEDGEECDPPAAGSCDDTCHIIHHTDVCTPCEISATTAGTCFQTSNTDNAGTTDSAKFGCNGFTGAALTACNDLIACMRATKCGAGDDPTPCLCGALPATTCATTPAASLPGVCAPKYVTAAAGGDVFGLFFSTDSPIGVSNNLYACDVDACTAQCLP
jgi:cysteine-rich repeat protein